MSDHAPAPEPDPVLRRLDVIIGQLETLISAFGISPEPESDDGGPPQKPEAPRIVFNDGGPPQKPEAPRIVFNGSGN